MNEVTLLSIFM